jgi:hypothetical protein
MKLNELVNVQTLEAVQKAVQNSQKLLAAADFLADNSPEVLAAEQAVYELWKIDPKKAQALWEEAFPPAPKGVTPSFIHRKAMSEGLPS